jgi:gluconate kinase
MGDLNYSGGGMIVHLNGWPGVGKQTIGRILAARLGARFIHNHLLHDVAIVCHGLHDPARWVLYEQVRQAVYQALQARPADEVFVMTNALCAGSEREREAWDHVVDLAMDRQVSLVPVVLEAAAVENERRLQDPERVGRKMVDPKLLREFIATDRIQEPDVAGLLVLDVTRLSAEAAAESVLRHISAMVAESNLSVAGDKFRRLR